MINALNGKIIIAVAAVASAVSLIATDPASAKSGRMYEVQEYKFDKPMHGFDGQASGGYYCSYVRLPKRDCKWNGSREVCKVKGWILRQECR